MLQPDGNGRRERQERGLIWAREDVVVSSGQNPRTDAQVYYVKLTETDEIFELGDVEHQVWRQFQGGQSLDAAERAAVGHMGREFRSRFRSLVAELAMRGLLYGEIPGELRDEFAADPRARRVQLQFQIDPDGHDPPHPSYRYPLFDANRPFGLLANWFGFLRYAVWPIGFAGIVAGLVLIKHSVEFHADFPPKVLSGYGIPHVLVMLLTVKLARTLVIGVVMRYYGIRIRVLALDLIFGFWPRFFIDRRSLLRLKRAPQLWAHSSTFFVQLSFFAFGTLGWWWFRGDGTIKSGLCLVMCQAGLFTLIISALPFFKNENYHWFCAYFEEPFLRERAQTALRSVFSRKISAFNLPSVERTALITYGLSMFASLLLVAYSLANLFMLWTGKYRGAGLALYLALCGLFVLWFVIRHSKKQRRVATRMERRDRRRSRRDGERAVESAPFGDR